MMIFIKKSNSWTFVEGTILRFVELAQTQEVGETFTGQA